jgi:hypothetical protein
MSEAERAVAIVPASRANIVRAGGSPDDVIEAFGEYQKIQAALDRALPDCIMEIQRRKFRKKNYWRAIATAFNLDVVVLAEERTEQGSDWGWIVTYRATAPNGRSTTGDGACFASEKAVYAKEWIGGKSRRKYDADGKPLLDENATRENQSIHNVRGHAHTRAFNRAVSNLVGFGEVSAEEMRREDAEHEEPRDVTPRRQPAPSDHERTLTDPPQRPAARGNAISDAQRKRIYALAYKAAEASGLKRDIAEGTVRDVVERHGYGSSTEIERGDYDSVCSEIETLLRGMGEPKPAADSVF